MRGEESATGIRRSFGHKFSSPIGSSTWYDESIYTQIKKRYSFRQGSIGQVRWSGEHERKSMRVDVRAYVRKHATHGCGRESMNKSKEAWAQLQARAHAQGRGHRRERMQVGVGVGVRVSEGVGVGAGVSVCMGVGVGSCVCTST
jgi:hypothetical protein